MMDRTQELLKALMINGWIIILVIIILIIMNAFGLFGFLKTASQKCILGDGFVCEEYSASTDDVESMSDGSVNDKIVFQVRNDFGQDVYNFKIHVALCERDVRTPLNTIPLFKNGVSYNYSFEHCAKLMPRSMFNSKLTLAYDTDINNTILNQGYISTFVSAPEPESYMQKFKFAFMREFRKYVG